jgi:hypothetical protein
MIGVSRMPASANERIVTTRGSVAVPCGEARCDRFAIGVIPGWLGTAVAAAFPDHPELMVPWHTQQECDPAH